jgi:hypothetical protein
MLDMTTPKHRHSFELKNNHTCTNNLVNSANVVAEMDIQKTTLLIYSVVTNRKSLAGLAPLLRGNTASLSL